MIAYDAPAKSSALTYQIMTDEAVLAAVQARGENTASPASTQTLLFTGLLFLGLGGLSWGWQTVVYLAAAIALHELGQRSTMKT